MTLRVRDSAPSNVFGLLGSDENSATYAFGWALDQVESLRRRVVETLFGKPLPVDDSQVWLQRHGADGGYTDIEIRKDGTFDVIFEAKRGWELPTLAQLQRYVVRLSKSRGARCLVTLTAADREFAHRHLPQSVEGVELRHLSWTDVRGLIHKARSDTGAYADKVWLRELDRHLQEYVAMERVTDNRVFVVVLSADPMMPGGKHTWRDVVEKDGYYFHPLGSGWPAQPPNYIGFRYDGRLQSVHHVDHVEVVRDLSGFNPLWLSTDYDHFVYSLGPAMRPPIEVRAGNIYPSGRVWCAIDTLLSGAFRTISEARDETKRRLRETSPADDA